MVTIGNTVVDLNKFDSSIVSLEGMNDGIFWSRHLLKTSSAGLDYGSLDVQVHHVSLKIPSKFYSSGSLELGFKQSMVGSIEKESGGVDSFKITAYYASCENRSPGTATINAGASVTRWTNDMLSCPSSSVWVECFSDPTNNANTYPRTAHIRYEESYSGYICTQEACAGCIGSITMDAVTAVNGGATIFDFSSDDFIFTGFGIEAVGSFSSLQISPPLNEEIGVGNTAVANSISHAEFCLVSIHNARNLAAEIDSEETEIEPEALLSDYTGEGKQSCWSSFAFFSKDKSTCFRDLGFIEAGWTTSLEPSVHPYSFDIYQSYSDCNSGSGEVIASLTGMSKF